jgi:DNA-binding transcriptional MerR regulator/methylmalonyl-CoA mutase cobalamin-binding subunit
MLIDQNTMALMSISAVERDTGLSKDTLRVWERRYGFPSPERDSSGERAYPPAQVEKLRLIKRLLDQGLRPSKLMAASGEELTALLEVRRSPPAEHRGGAGRAALMPLIRQHRSDELRATLSQMLMRNGLQRFVVEVVAPMNADIGDAWLRGEIEVHEEHLYTEQLQNVLRGAISSHPAGIRRPRVILTTLPDEEHGLGLLMAEAMLVPEGAQCVALGTRTPLADVRSAAIACAADVVALSFSAAYPLRQAVEGLNTLRTSLPETISIWAGGAAVRDRNRQLPGIRIICGIEDTLQALEEWRAEHRAGLS